MNRKKKLCAVSFLADVSSIGDGFVGVFLDEELANTGIDFVDGKFSWEIVSGGKAQSRKGANGTSIYKVGVKTDADYYDEKTGQRTTGHRGLWEYGIVVSNSTENAAQKAIAYYEGQSTKTGKVEVIQTDIREIAENERSSFFCSFMLP